MKLWAKCPRRQRLLYSWIRDGFICKQRYASPPDSYPAPSPFLFHGVTVAGRAYWPLVLNEPRRLYPFHLRGSTSSDLATQAKLPGNGGMSRTTAEDRSGRLKSRREGPSPMFGNDGTLSNQLLPPIPDPTSQNTSNSSVLQTHGSGNCREPSLLLTRHCQ